MRQTPPGGIMAVVANPLEKTRLQGGAKLPEVFSF
jgi:hypothetical protein